MYNFFSIIDEKEIEKSHMTFVAKGSFGSIFKDNNNNAYKLIPLLNLKGELNSNTLREINFSLWYKNEYIANCFDVFISFTNKNYYFYLKQKFFKYNFLQYIKETSTDVLLENFENIFYKLCLSLKHIHNNTLAHGDIKPTNILVSDNKIVITDFGGINFEDGHTFNQTCTLYYRSPELFIKNKRVVSPKNDIWSLGITMLVYITKSKILKIDISEIHKIFLSKKNPIEHILKSCGSIINKKNSRILEILKLILVYDYNKRPSIDEIINFVNERETFNNNLQYEEDIIEYYSTELENREIILNCLSKNESLKNYFPLAISLFNRYVKNNQVTDKCKILNYCLYISKRFLSDRYFSYSDVFDNKMELDIILDILIKLKFKIYEKQFYVKYLETNSKYDLKEIIGFNILFLLSKKQNKKTFKELKEILEKKYPIIS